LKYRSLFRSSSPTTIVKTISSTAVTAVISNRTQRSAYFKIRKQEKILSTVDDDEVKIILFPTVG